MGYTHYWHRPQMIPGTIWHRIRADVEALILPLSDQGVKLAGGLGTSTPEITNDLIRFNGVKECGHIENEEIIIPYPSADAHGIGPSETAIDGDFYGVGVTLRHRCCNGLCAYETIFLSRSLELRPSQQPDKQGLYIEHVKTAFRPFDIAVTAVLLIAKHHLRGEMCIHSNGADAQWIDARRICQTVLGYGEWFGIVEEQVIEEYPERRGVTVRTLVETHPPEL